MPHCQWANSQPLLCCLHSLDHNPGYSRWKGNFDGKIPVKRSQPYPSGSLSPWKDSRQDSPVKWPLHLKIMDINTVPQRLICSWCLRWCGTSPMEGLATLGPWLSPPWASLTLYCAPPSFIQRGWRYHSCYLYKEDKDISCYQECKHSPLQHQE